MATVRKVKEDRGIGVFYWEPAWLPIPDCTWASTSGSQYMQEKMAAGNAMANMALFDAAGNANSALLHMKTMWVRNDYEKRNHIDVVHCTGGGDTDRMRK